MPKTSKVLQVLRLFGGSRKQLRATDIASLFGVSPATAYRYVSELAEAGFIERASAGHYVLGPTIVELDREIRINDPLIAAASEVMRTLCERSGATIILSRLHGNKVVCVSEMRGRYGPTTVSYERGRAMPLYRGATSKVIFAHMAPAEIAAIAQRDASGLRKAGVPAARGALVDYLAEIRARPVYATAGEVDPEAMGWAVALHHGKHLLGSLSAIYSKATPEAARARIGDQLVRAGLRIEGRLEAPGHTSQT
ncbi:DNA-binding protein [Variovorax sp. WS11]|uniref:IclR family transcriptional regulator n=1 Tax=Variovorax sp. WS11 TaxID=1105204 RepID=UPI000D0D4EB4|nr:helix-turn-helix domain-containing protein [Variovorax sp. WS11]NDZ18331.1 helix-turn-helix domain-containing protein [Variovorax sp. WS11]PSL84328.1 DNA-binding protein [Variovorax sp. WS11]